MISNAEIRHFDYALSTFSAKFSELFSNDIEKYSAQWCTDIRVRFEVE